MFPAALLARQQKKLVIPIFVRPSFERHEVEKRRYDQALAVSHQLDAAQIRFIEILNDRGYVDADPQPQSVVWERMNVPIARALRGLLYVLWDLSQVDPSDLSALFAGPGRLRIGFSELSPSREATRAINDRCGRAAMLGQRLLQFQRARRHVVDLHSGAVVEHRRCQDQERYRGEGDCCRLHRLQSTVRASVSDAPAVGRHRAVRGGHRHPSADRRRLVSRATRPSRPGSALAASRKTNRRPAREIGRSFPPAARAIPSAIGPHQTLAPFGSFWDLALAINRSDPEALEMANNGASGSVSVDPAELRKLLGTVWFRSVFPRLSNAWRERLLEVLVDSVIVPNHLLKLGRREVRMRDAGLTSLRNCFRSRR